MQFHQVIVSANPRDAITTAAFELQEFLGQIGPSNIYSRYMHADLERDELVLPLRDFATRQSARPSDDVIIYHASIGEPEVTQFIAARPERLIVIYHNISPPERFLPFDPAFSGLLAGGRIELASLADKTVLALTISQYNAAELREMGFRNVVVTPFVIDLDRLRAIEPNAPTLNHFAVSGAPMVLFVGQMLPHKRPDLLLQAYHVLSTYLLPEAMLVMVGNHRLPRYSQQLTHLVNELNLDRAWITGSVTPDMLAAFYRSATVFVTLSEHEGFCVPVIEAMGFDVPVIARAAAAIPETVGDAAMLLPDQDDLALAAEAMQEVIESTLLRRRLIEAGRRRITRHDPDIARAEIVLRILEVVPS